jgi:hypothetical protein
MNKSKSEKSSSFLKALMGKLFALFIGTMIAIALAEIVTRIAMPIFPGMYKLDQNGQRLEIHNVAPNSTYRQFSEEFDALTTIQKDGYRIPDSKGNPDLVFIGDSFTYGQGLSDEDTFVMQYCKKTKTVCMNLGVPGYGTIEAVERLEGFLKDKNIRPKKVNLVMLAMISYLGSGNDLYDNLNITDSRSAPESESNEEESEGLLRKVSDKLLEHSNFTRVIKFHFAPIIKKMIVIKPEEDQLQRALEITKHQLIKLDTLSKQYKFEWQVILIHPVQDISRGTHQKTFNTIQSISPVKVIPSAKWFEPNPNQYYFSLDGHFNKAGSDKMVELFLSMDKN